ncbi:hypothetical protein BMF94_3955 [Rhodotorula taiwanensis]|uniref:TFIIS N-terminal domain-containing protein n=1 Tax=Rhodotorula taiwanensis TaxID=741276 RepID=A0A2S5B878_9BASI|nr:hypothetical protein BMF94_3955 [Rhodotorula taiwanensis]
MSDTEDRQASPGVGEEAAGSGSREESPALPEPPAMTGNDDDDANNGNEQPQGLVDIFGGDDSDLTELSSDEDEAPARPAPRRRSPSAASSRSASPDAAHAAGEGLAGPSSDEDEGDDYRDDEGDRIKKMKIAKRKKRADEGGDGDEGAPKPKKKKSSGKKRVQREEEPQEEEIQLDPETRRRKDLASRLSAIVKKPQGTKGRKKKAQDEEDLEMLNDEAVATLRKDMLRAADDDREQNELGRPAVNKLKMLPRVVDLMQKTALADTIVEGGLLEAVRAWLEPLPDRSLPALNIQRPLFNLLRTLSIELSALKSSGLGKVVYFYTKCKRVDPQIKRVADQLVADWMRPILRRSGAFVDRESGASGGYGSASHAAAIAAARKLAMQQGAGAGATRHARIPEALTATFQNVPGNAVTGQMASLPGSGTGSKMRTFKAKLQASSQAARRV